MSSGMNVQQAKELASKRNYKWAVGNLKRAYGISYKKATKILLYELAEIADRLVFCKDCRWSEPNREGDYDCMCHIPIFRVSEDGWCYLGERKDNE